MVYSRASDDPSRPSRTGPQQAPAPASPEAPAPEPPAASPAGEPVRGRARHRSIYVRQSTEATAKLLVVGPYGVGKTTLIGQVSEIPPLRTEEVVTQAGAVVDDLTGIRDKSHTTVALDFGRLSLSGGVVLYLFGAPGQQRFMPVVADLARGAYGALVLADTRRLDQSFEALGLVEAHQLPYAVALNTFPDAPVHAERELREAMDLAPGTPLVSCDARDAASSTRALIALVRHLSTLIQENP